VRIGVLSTAKIAKRALVMPAQTLPEIAVTAIASGDVRRARESAKNLGIPTVHESYEALLADPDIDAVYIPLPNAMHGSWSIKAMEAGKHVLCEKPIACNEQEARRVADVASRTGRVICESMHPRYHGLFDRIEELLAAGAIGDVRHVEARVCFVTPNRKDNRWRYEMGGGALMDLGVYAVTIVRLLAGMEPEQVTLAAAKLRTPDVDRRLDVRFRFPNGATGRIVTSMWGWPLLAAKAWVDGSRGRMTVDNPVAPQLGNRIDIRLAGKTTRERVAKLPDSYTCEIQAFANAILRGEHLHTGPDHFLANMRVIDTIYRHAGLPLRGAPRGGPELGSSPSPPDRPATGSDTCSKFDDE
jgi:predicted dehydrogenase